MIAFVSGLVFGVAVAVGLVVVVLGVALRRERTDQARLARALWRVDREGVE